MTAIKVIVAETLGSAPREAGAAMIVSAEGQVGSIGGGALEKRAVEAAREMLSEGTQHQQMRLPLGPTLQQCCGGYVILELTATEQRDVAPYDQRETLFLYGAGHVGRAVVQALSALPFDIIWVDARQDWRPVAGDHCRAISGDPLAVAREATSDAYHLIMTHDHGLDLELCDALLRRDDTVHVGLIGSASKKVRFVSQLRARGLTEAQIGRLVCPIGVIGIKGKEPAVIAAAVAAELLLVRSRRMRMTDQVDGALHA
ncbi:MAG: xanthine dehydrogenase accessory protein XdhC [Pseudomonadota bacterium]